MHLFFFGDQTLDVQPHLKDLTRYRHNPVLEDFLTKSYYVLRTELDKLPNNVKLDLPRFTCIDDILFCGPGSTSCIALDLAVTTMYQLGVFISQHAGHSGQDDTCVLGICTGALAAAAVSCSSNTHTLGIIPMALDAVKIAFRTGLYVTDVANRLEHIDTIDQSWLLSVPGVEATEDALKRFSENSLLPTLRKPYITAFMLNSVMISGPPSTLEVVKRSAEFENLKPQYVPINGPYHAPHLYSQNDVDEIVGDLTCQDVGSQDSRKVVLVSGEGKRVEGDDFASILKAAVKQMLREQIHWDAIMKQLLTFQESTGKDTLNITSIGAKNENFVYNALRQSPLRTYLPCSKPTSIKPTVPETPILNDHLERQKLAIVGMSGRFPGANDIDSFWSLLEQGLDVHKPVPPTRWDVNTHVDPTRSNKNTSGTPFGCWLDNPELFDARFFNISPREAPQIDPAQRLALMTAYEAIEQAGIVPDSTPSTRRDRVGVFYGSTANDWMETNSAQNIDTYFIPGGNRAFIPGRINYYFKFSGPSYAVDTACSSSLAGIHLACNALWRREIDTAIAGGSNVLSNPDFTAGLDRGQFLSRTGNCKTFDDSADGYCRGEGVGTVIIKRLDDALADKDPILGVVLSASTNHSAESDSITRPHVGAQREILGNILNRGATNSQDVSYVEMHGTGTQVGDASEMSSVLETFAPARNCIKKARASDNPVYLGSAKANIGHGEAASGVTSLIKVLLMMQRDTIVPHCGIKTKINHKFPTDLDERNANIALSPKPWGRDSAASQTRRVVVNNFSAAGGNSALLLEDAPLKPQSLIEAADPRSHHVVAVSGKIGASLQGNLRSMIKYLMENPDVHLGRLSYTTTARRLHHPHRVMAAGSKAEYIATQLQTALDDQTGMTRPKGVPKVVFAFTGQGAHYPGMGKEFLDNYSLFRNEINRLDQLGRTMGFPSVMPVLTSDSKDVDISAFQPSAVQLAGVCMQIALVKLWASWGITPTAAFGHSLGEYPALNIAGILSDADTLYLVGKRAQLLEQKCDQGTHAMLAIKGSVDNVSGALKGKDYEIACINSPAETVLAAPNEELAEQRVILAAAGFKSTLLKVPFAFHSPQVEPILNDFKKIASGVSFSTPKVPLLSAVDGNIHTDNTVFSTEYLTTHTRQPVMMHKALQTASSQGILSDAATVLEIGSHPAVSGMVKGSLGPEVTCLSTSARGRPIFQILTSTLITLYSKGADITWPQYHADFKGSQEVLPLPTYSWDLKPYWIQYVHDWSLRKGDPPQVIQSGPGLESTTVHRVVEESGDGSKTKIIVEADIARKDLSPLVQGHEVDGIPLCTPSVYADIALTLGKYLREKHRPDQEEDLVDVTEMVISKALILRGEGQQQLLQAHAEVDWKEGGVKVKFMSFDSRGKLQQHSECTIRYRARETTLTSLQSNSNDIKSKAQTLRSQVTTGETARYTTAMVYRAIRPLAKFHADYRGIDEVLLNSNTLEAASRLSFGAVKRGGQFNTHPAIIDSLTQSCGFTMNCNDYSDLDREVFMNHGWRNFQIFEPLDFEKVYYTYTQMSEGKDKLWHGDVVVFDGDRVVAFFGQIAIQGVPRRVLKTILSIESGSQKKGQQQPAQKESPASEKATIANGRPTPPPSPTSKAAPGPKSKFPQALEIIADESGLALTDLTDGTVFADAGIDSLLSLTIAARFKEELDLDMDFSALFDEYPTVDSLKALLGGSESTGAPLEPTSSRGSSSGAESGVKGYSTPPSSDDEALDTGNVDFKRILEIISEESGVAIEDLTDDTTFGDAGIDSLLSLIIVSRFRDELEMDIQHESLLTDCPSVAELKMELVGDVSSANPAKKETEPDGAATLSSIPASGTANEHIAPKVDVGGGLETNGDVSDASLAARKKAVDGYVEKYTTGFEPPTATSNDSSRQLGDADPNAKVVLVTGATGSLGGHLVDTLAQRPDVATVVCLNRINKAEPYARQQKAMRDKGIRSFDKIRSKLLVLQTDTSKPLLGLPEQQYENLVNSVTYLIHNAWPMSAKRELHGFESQFQVLRNLIDFATIVSSRRPDSFKFRFQMVSSIAVVGHHHLAPECNSRTETVVPEDRVKIVSVLPNGYGEAKWACERILDETLHKHLSSRIRTMVVRLGQIAGSKRCGYWNPTEHFGFLVKSSQTLNALPDVPGLARWTPVEDVAGTLVDIVLATQSQGEDAEANYPVYHIDHPTGQPWRDVNEILASALDIPTTNLIPFAEWAQKVRTAPSRDNPASMLGDFFVDNYLRMSCGGLVLDVDKSLQHSKVLRDCKPVSEEVIRKYVHVWQEIGFLK